MGYGACGSCPKTLLQMFQQDGNMHWSNERETYRPSNRSLCDALLQLCALVLALHAPVGEDIYLFSTVQLVDLHSKIDRPTRSAHFVML